MKNVVIAGSSKLQTDINHWLNFFKEKNFRILDYPRPIDSTKFMELYPNVHKEFYENINKADVLFIMNEDKNGKSGYIGVEAFAELAYGLAQKLVYNNEIELVILQMPSKDVQCYEEINLWLNLGWIKLFNESSLNK